VTRKWSPISDALILNNGPSANIWEAGPVENAMDIVKQGRCHTFTWPLRFNDDLPSGYNGLHIHTHPNTWRGIPLPIPRSNVNKTIKVWVLAKTIPSFYAGASDFGGAVDLWVSDGTTSPTNIPWELSPEGEATAFSSFSRNFKSIGNTPSLLEFTLSITPQPAYGGDSAPPLPPLVLWIRSDIGDEVTVPNPLYFGTPQEDFFNFRRAAMELPLSFDPNDEKPPLTGRLLQKSFRPLSAERGDISMEPYPQWYFVECENLYQETRDPLKPGEWFYGCHTFPPFPTEVLEPFTLRNRRAWEASVQPTEAVDKVFETTGLQLLSVTVEELD
jgi:hypothetical protein